MRLTVGLGRPGSRRWPVLIVILGGTALAVLGYTLLHLSNRPTARLRRLHAYWADPAAHADWMVQGGSRCGGAPFLLPSDGFIGFGWGDSMRLGHSHQGLDIFGPTGPDGLGETPVYAAFAGYLTRLPDWRSAVIIRIGSDPLHDGRQIWTYYTHMATEEGVSFISDRFPPGTAERFVSAGTLLGYQGNFSGDPDNPTGMHLHFSIVRDDGQGGFMNELRIENTLDPSPYLGLEASSEALSEQVAICREG